VPRNVTRIGRDLESLFAVRPNKYDTTKVKPDQGKSWYGDKLRRARYWFNRDNFPFRDKVAVKHRRRIKGASMSVSTSFASAVLIALLVAPSDSALGNSLPSQQVLKTYALPESTQSADISPDEQSVVTVGTRKLDVADSEKKTIAHVVQLWNFKEGKQLAEYTAQKSEVRVAPKGSHLDPSRTEPIVRFSPDGDVVVALIDRTIHVLRAADLTELRAFPLDAPDNATRTSPSGRTIVHEPSARAMELSPGGEVVAVLWVSEMLHGRIQLYDLSSGKRALSWDTPQGWIYFTRSIVWHPNGKLLLIAIPNESPCSSPGSQPDIFAFDVQTGAIKQKIRTGLLTGSIAVSSDSRVLAVDFNCFRVFKNHDPKLKVFDLTTGKHLRSVSARETGARYLVSASADGSRFLAFTGKIAAKFDWSDAVSYDKVVDETFSVWSLTSYEGIVTSQNILGLKKSELRLSSKGKYAVSYGKASFVYELP
jgi:WD40 repeat protein